MHSRMARYRGTKSPDASTRRSLVRTLTAERDRLSSVLRATDVDATKIKAELLVKVQDVKALLGRHIPQARQMLRKLLADKIELEPVGTAETGATSSEEPSRSTG